MDMNDEEFQKLHDERWRELPVEIKERAKQIILAYYEPSAIEQARNMHKADPVHWMAPYHFNFGMGVRNLLRSGSLGEKQTGIDGISDSELPSKNWDDYYVAALEYAAGVRDA